MFVCARQRMRPKFTNLRARAESTAKCHNGSGNWKIEGLKRMITRTENQRLLNKFETEGFMAQRGL